MPATQTGKTGGWKEMNVPAGAIWVVIVLLVIALGAAGWYAFNGGWKTEAQKDEVYYHQMLPLLAAGHGDMEPLEAENKLRKQKGQPLLVFTPRGSRPVSAEAKAKAEEFKKKLKEMHQTGGTSATPSASK
jgi:hypothetical protein